MHSRHVQLAEFFNKHSAASSNNLTENEVLTTRRPNIAIPLSIEHEETNYETIILPSSTKQKS
jgi:hypothetical protein